MLCSAKQTFCLNSLLSKEGCKGRLFPGQEGLKGPGIEIGEAACVGERQIRNREVWRALGGSQGRDCQWDVALSARGRVDCRFLTTGVLYLPPVPPPKSFVSAWRSRTKPAKDTPHFLCPGDGLVMEMRQLLPRHGLLWETDVSPGMFCMGSPCLPLTSLHGGF